MGLSVSCQPRYLGYEHFVKLVQNANSYILGDKEVLEEDEKEALLKFFSNIQIALQNNLYGKINKQLPWYSPYEGGPGLNWPHSERIKEYFKNVRLAVPKTLKARKIYAYASNPIKNSSSGGIIDFNEDFSNATPQTQVQLSHVYALITFLWIMYKDGHNSAKYFYKSDILHYLCQNCEYHSSFGQVPDRMVNTYQIDALTRAIEKIYFTGSSGMIPARCLVLPTCEFRVLRGSLKGFDGNNLLLKVPINSGELYYTTTPVIIETVNDQIDWSTEDEKGSDEEIKSTHFTRSNDVEEIQNNIDDLVEKLRQASEIPEKCGKCLEQGAAGKHLAGTISRHEHCEKKHYTKSVDSPIKDRDNLSEKVEEYLKDISHQKRKHCKAQNPKSRTTNEYLQEILYKLNLICEHYRLKIDKRNE